MSIVYFARTAIYRLQNANTDYCNEIND